MYASSNHAVGFARGRRCSRPTPGPDPTASTASARPHARPCAASITAATASPSPAYESAAFAIARRPAVTVDVAVTRRHHPARRRLSALARPRFAMAYGISRNTRGWWDLDSARLLGYEPHDDAERWAAEIERTPPTEDDDLDRQYVGGDFAGGGTENWAGSSIAAGEDPTQKCPGGPPSSREVSSELCQTPSTAMNDPTAAPWRAVRAEIRGRVVPCPRRLHVGELEDDPRTRSS